jgi:hypothetical protein
MPKKNKKFTIELYTNEPLSAARTIFGPGVYENMVEPRFNPASVRLCAPCRYRSCVASKKCDRLTPQNDSEARKLIGEEAKFGMLSEDEQEKLAKVLLRAFKRCRKVTMTIRES